MIKNRKSLGQHWLKDRDVLFSIADEANLSKEDTVLEIGPGLGTLTSVLLNQAGRVVAVEYDEQLAGNLPKQFPGKNLEVINGDILSFDFRILPEKYKVVANIPYYITAKIVQTLLTCSRKPTKIVLLVQKEVAERIAAAPGKMSILAISAQVFAEVRLGPVVGAELFTPPPKVDSQVVVFDIYKDSKVDDVDERSFFTLVKIGFSSPRKKLLKNLCASGKLGSKERLSTILLELGIGVDVRAQDLSINQWKQLYAALSGISNKEDN